MKNIPLVYSTSAIWVRLLAGIIHISSNEKCLRPSALVTEGSWRSWPDLQQGLHISRQFATAHSNSCHIQVSCAVTPSALDSSLTCTAVCLRVEKRTERSLGKQILTQLKRQTNSSGPPEIPYPSVTVGAEESVLCSHED